MTRPVTLKVEPWVVVVAVALTAIVGWMLLGSPMTGSESGMNMGQPMQVDSKMMPMMQEMSTMIDKAVEEVDNAIEQAALATDAPDLETAQAYLEEILNALKPKEGIGLHNILRGLSSKMEGSQMKEMMSSMPMMQGNMSMQHSDMMQTLSSITSDLLAATDHFSLAMQQTELDTMKLHLEEGIDLLHSIKGGVDTGGLLMMQDSMMMNMGKFNKKAL